MQRARQIELERIALERDRLAQLQTAQLQQTEMVLANSATGLITRSKLTLPMDVM